MDALDGLGEQDRAALSLLGKYLRILGKAAQDVPGKAKTWVSDWARQVEHASTMGEVHGGWAVDMLRYDTLFIAKVRSPPTVSRTLLTREQQIRRWLMAIHPAYHAGLHELIELVADLEIDEAEEAEDEEAEVEEAVGAGYLP